VNDRRVPTSFVGLDIIVPDDWERTVLTVPRTPPSMNDNEIRSHWTGFQRHKKSWQTEIEQLLMLSGLRRGWSRAIAGAKMSFPRSAARRDSGNFANVVEKALGDALANGRWIPDDDAGRYLFVGVEFNKERDYSSTELVVFTHKEEG
jgi:hypothetical protein